MGGNSAWKTKLSSLLFWQKNRYSPKKHPRNVEKRKLKIKKAVEIISVAFRHVREIYEQKGSNIIILYLIVNFSCRQPR